MPSSRVISVSAVKMPQNGLCISIYSQQLRLRDEGEVSALGGRQCPEGSSAEGGERERELLYPDHTGRHIALCPLVETVYLSVHNMTHETVL